MNELIEVFFTFPTIVWTLAVFASIIYWIIIAMGFIDLSVDGSEGILEQIGAGGGESVGEPDVAYDGSTQGDILGSGDTVPSWARVGTRGVPWLLFLSFLSFFAWALSIATMRVILPAVSEPPHSLLLRFGVLVSSGVIALYLTSYVSRPLGRVFEIKRARSLPTLVGRSCALRTSRVDANFGQARYDDGGAELLLHVRCEHNNSLQRGDRLRIVGHDPERDVLFVAPDPVSDTEPEEAEDV